MSTLTAGPAWSENAFRKAVQTASPSVVKIVTNVLTSFGGGAGFPYGSGVIVHDDGYIVTTGRPTVGGGLRLTVVLPDGSRHAAQIVKTEDTSGLTLLKVACTGLRPVELRLEDAPHVGQWVVTIGNPFGLSRTRTDPLSASVGVISAFRRLNAKGFDYAKPVILTDVTLNPGGQGGAMVDLDGRLVGVCGRVLTSTRTNTQLSYAVPAAEVAALLDDVLKTTTPRPLPQDEPTPPRPEEDRGYLGAYILDEAEGTKGAYVDKVVPDSPAGKAGLAAGDLVTAINGRSISNGRQLITRLDGLGAGVPVELTVSREKAERKITVTLGQVPRPVLK